MHVYKAQFGQQLYSLSSFFPNIFSDVSIWVQLKRKYTTKFYKDLLSHYVTCIGVW